MYTDSYGRSNFSGRTKLKEVAESLRKGDSLPTVTVRQLLGWFGQQRRGWRVVATVKGALRRAGLSTEPDFETAYIDGQLEFLLSDPKGASPRAGKDQDGEDVSEGNENQEDSPSETPIEDQCCPTNFSAVRVESVRFCDQAVRSGVRTGPGAVFARTG